MTTTAIKRVASWQWHSWCCFCPCKSCSDKIEEQATKFECLQVFLGKTCTTSTENMGHQTQAFHPNKLGRSKASGSGMPDLAESCRLEPVLGHQCTASHRKGKKKKQKSSLYPRTDQLQKHPCCPVPSIQIILTKSALLVLNRSTPCT